MDSHDMIDNIERQLSKSLHIELTAHMDPVVTDDPVVSEMKAVASAVADTLNGVSSVHDLRAVTGPTHTNIIFDVVIEPGCPLSTAEIHRAFQQAVSEKNENYYVVINYDKTYIHCNE